MTLDLNTELGYAYKNRTQQIRRMSEDWVARNGYCLNCDSDQLIPTTANTRTRDFICEKCRHGYELKSKLGVFSNSVLDGAYGAMIRTIRDRRTPTFLLLEYTSSWSILRLRAIHHSLITEQAIVPRKPLSASARRAGWIGCNIVLPAIAIQGQIPLITDGSMCAKKLSLLGSSDRTATTLPGPSASSRAPLPLALSSSSSSNTTRNKIRPPSASSTTSAPAPVHE